VYGQLVIVESNHKPLESIIQKPLAAAPPRLQRMILHLQRFNFTIVHRPGKEIPVADTLPKKSLSDHDKKLSEGMNIQVPNVYSRLPVSDISLQEIKEETNRDTQPSMLKKIIHDGWPEDRRKCPDT